MIGILFSGNVIVMRIVVAGVHVICNLIKMFEILNLNLIIKIFECLHILHEHVKKSLGKSSKMKIPRVNQKRLLLFQIFPY
jgi:hypothetical protein